MPLSCLTAKCQSPEYQRRVEVDESSLSSGYCSRSVTLRPNPWCHSLAGSIPPGDIFLLANIVYVCSHPAPSCPRMLTQTVYPQRLPSQALSKALKTRSQRRQSTTSLSFEGPALPPSSFPRCLQSPVCAAFMCMEHQWRC